MEFVPHLKGPYSFDLENLAKNPFHLKDCWEYIPPGKGKGEKIKGGYLKITECGENKYRRLLEGLDKKAEKDSDALALKAALDLIVPLYIRLEWDELLLLLYTDETNREFSRKSELSRRILQDSTRIIDNLIRKRIVPQEKRADMLRRIENARWLA